jgi:hypothetical protein
VARRRVHWAKGGCDEGAARVAQRRHQPHEVAFAARDAAAGSARGAIGGRGVADGPRLARRVRERLEERVGECRQRLLAEQVDKVEAPLGQDDVHVGTALRRGAKVRGHLALSRRKHHRPILRHEVQDHGAVHQEGERVVQGGGQPRGEGELERQIAVEREHRPAAGRAREAHDQAVGPRGKRLLTERARREAVGEHVLVERRERKEAHGLGRGDEQRQHGDSADGPRRAAEHRGCAAQEDEGAQAAYQMHLPHVVICG